MKAAFPAQTGTYLWEVGGEAPDDLQEGRAPLGTSRTRGRPAWCITPGSLDEPPDADPHVRWCGRGEPETDSSLPDVRPAWALTWR
jgi:hypothetical protein